MGMLEWRAEVEAMLDQVCSLLFFRYKSAPLLVRDVGVYFCRFLEEFLEILKELFKGEDFNELGLLIYL
jgi:hypothetical protein